MKLTKEKKESVMSDEELIDIIGLDTPKETQVIDKVITTEKGKVKEYKHIEHESIINKVKERLQPDKTMIINMEMRNGMHKTFMISVSNDSFSFNKGKYILDNEMKYFNVSYGCYCLDYHIDLSVPLKRKVNLNEIKATVKHSGLIETDTALNPSLIEEFMNRKVVEQVMRGQDFEEALRNLKFAVYIGTLAGIINLILIIKSSGMMNNFHLPF